MRRTAPNGTIRIYLNSKRQPRVFLYVLELVHEGKTQNQIGEEPGQETDRLVHFLESPYVHKRRKNGHVAIRVDLGIK